MMDVKMLLNNRYQLGKVIGEGGFAQIFLARDVQLGREVAIKVLHSGMAGDQEYLRRFQQEARLVAELNHPNIMPIYDYGEYQGNVYLVMPFINGGTLQQRLQHGPLSLDETGHYLSQLTAALDYAHSRQMVHRDIKPQNMLLTQDGRLLLADFGIARLNSDNNAHQPTRALGTISYMAPEQFNGQVSPRTDIYSLGVVLYQMLSGHLPFTGTTSQVLSAHHISPVPSLIGQPAVQALPPGAVKQFDAVIAKAMAKPPELRYASAGELLAAFHRAATLAAEEYSAETMVGVPSAPPTERIQFTSPQPWNVPSTQPVQFAPGGNKPAKKWLWPVVGGSLIGLALIVFLITRLLLPAPAPTPITILPAATDTPAVATTSGGGGASGIIVVNQPTTAPATTAAPVATATSTPVPSNTPVPLTATPTRVPPTSTPVSLPARDKFTALSAPSGYTIYRNSLPSQLNLEVAYPKSWSVVPADNGLSVSFSDQDKATVTIVRATNGTRTVSLDELNASFINDYKSKGWTVRGDSRFWSFAGETWLQSSYQKATRRTWIMLSLHNSVPYAVFLEGEDSNFDSYLSGGQFGDMLDNMRFMDAPVNFFTGETRSYRSNSYVINYPIKDWTVTSNNNGTFIDNKDSSRRSRFYVYDVATSSLDLNSQLIKYRDEIANNGTYENFKVIQTYRPTVRGDIQEQVMRFSFTIQGTSYVGELYLRKQGNKVYVGVGRSTQQDDLDIMYYDLWRYIEFVK